MITRIKTKSRKLKTKWILDLQENLLDQMAENLAKEIDKEIINKIYNECKIYEEFIKEEEFSV